MLPRIKKRPRSSSRAPASVQSRGDAGTNPAGDATWTIIDALRHYDIARWHTGQSFKQWLSDMEAAGRKMEWR